MLEHPAGGSVRRLVSFFNNGRSSSHSMDGSTGASGNLARVSAEALGEVGDAGLSLDTSIKPSDSLCQGEVGVAGLSLGADAGPDGADGADENLVGAWWSRESTTRYINNVSAGGEKLTDEEVDEVNGEADVDGDLAHYDHADE